MYWGYSFLFILYKQNKDNSHYNNIKAYTLKNFIDFMLILGFSNLLGNLCKYDIELRGNYEEIFQE